jgi:hypothetical protein
MTTLRYAEADADEYVPGLERDPIATLRSFICAVSCVLVVANN